MAEIVAESSGNWNMSIVSCIVLCNYDVATMLAARCCVLSRDVGYPQRSVSFSATIVKCALTIRYLIYSHKRISMIIILFLDLEININNL